MTASDFRKLAAAEKNLIADRAAQLMLDQVKSMGGTSVDVVMVLQEVVVGLLAATTGQAYREATLNLIYRSAKNDLDQIERVERARANA
jgi:hypothetical protein